MIGLLFFCGYLGLKSLCSVTNPPPAAEILIRNTNITNPDTASFQNCQWSDTEKAMIPVDQSKPFSFGFLFEQEYRVLSVDPTKDATFDDSAAFWGFIENDGKAFVYYPFSVKPTPLPKGAKFLREVHSTSSPREN